MDFIDEHFLAILGLVATLVLGFYFSAIEMAFSSLNRPRLKAIENGLTNKTKKIEAARALSLHEDRFDELISTLLICNNTVAIASATLSAALFVRLIGEWGYLVSTLAVSAIVIVFTDILPKSTTKENPEKVAIRSAKFVSFLMTAFKFINKGILTIKKLFAKNKNEEDKEEAGEFLSQELTYIVEEAEREGSLLEDDRELITNAIDFNETLMKDLLTPRVDVIGVSIEATVGEIKEIFLKEEYTRLIVYGENIDDVKGIVHLRDFLKLLAGDRPEKTLTDILRTPVFTVESARVSDALRLLKEAHTHLVVVLDEYGGMAGIVTMDDILERLVGDIWDEHDVATEDFLLLENDDYRVLCTAYSEDFFEFFDLDVSTESSTVGGWIMDVLRRIPTKADAFEFENLHVTVTKVDEGRPTECLIKVLKQ